MRAQVLYDLREKWEFCSGNDLHDWFLENVGEPSPSGRRFIKFENARQFIYECYLSLINNTSQEKEVTFRREMRKVEKIIIGINNRAVNGHYKEGHPYAEGVFFKGDYIS